MLLVLIVASADRIEDLRTLRWSEVRHTKASSDASAHLLCLPAVPGKARNHRSASTYNEQPAFLHNATATNGVLPVTCRYVSFPVQTLGKCAKILPVMAWGTVIMHKRCDPSPCAQDVCMAVIRAEQVHDVRAEQVHDVRAEQVHDAMH